MRRLTDEKLEEIRRCALEATDGQSVEEMSARTRLFRNARKYILELLQENSQLNRELEMREESV